MCRIIAASGLVSLDFLVDNLRFMAKKGHVDGWGAVFRCNGHLLVNKSVVSCLEDFNLDEYRGVFSDLAVFHARKARTGPDINMTHPFRVGPYLVFHNARFSNGEYDPLRVVRHLEKYLPLDAGSFASAMADLDNFYGVNCVLVSPEKVLVGVRNAGRSYYKMVYSCDKKGVVVSSARLPVREWSDLPDGSVLSLLPDGKMFLNK